MDYVEELRQTNGKKDAIDLEEMLKANQALFAGGEISDEAKCEFFNAIVQAYVECGAAAKAKFGRKKDPERAID